MIDAFPDKVHLLTLNSKIIARILKDIFVKLKIATEV